MKQDLAYDKELHESPQKSMRSGFFWIGIASVLSQILAACTMFIVMLFVSKSEMGIATLAIAFINIFEALNSLGTNKALLQDNDLTPAETQSVFWFSSFFGLAVFIVAIPLSFPVAWFYELDALIPLFIVAMLKLPVVCVAAVPLQLINRRLEYKKISLTNMVTSLVCNILKIVLAAYGAGAWSLVIGETLFGFGTLIGAFGFSKFKPQLHFRLHECKRFIQYGYKACAAGLLTQFNKNLHYLIVGKFLGEGVLGIYRIAYELAMTPSMAMYDVVNKSSFPIFARLKEKRSELSQLFLWNQGNIGLFAAIPTAFILFGAADIFELMTNPEWVAATPVIPFVLTLSFLKALLQTYPDLFQACGKPEYPLITLSLEAILIGGLCSLALWIAPPAQSLQAMVSTWIGVLAILTIVYRSFAKHFIDALLVHILSNLRHGLGVLAFTSLISVPLWLYRDLLPYKQWSHIILQFLISGVCLLIYTKFVMKVSIRDLLGKKKKPADDTKQS